MCTQKPPQDYSGDLYERYKEDTDNYVKSTVLPPLKEMHGELLLRGLVERWGKYKRIVKFQMMVFRYLERYYIPKKALPPLQKVSFTSFQDMVFNEIKSTVTATVIGMIDDEREGKSIDRDLLNNVLDIFVQTGDGNLDIYRDDFEQTFFNATTNYYSRKAQTLNKECSDHDYMLKVEECLQEAEERVAHYLRSSTEPQLMEAVRSALTTRHAELTTEA
ncbi:hypothetical protein GQ55_2G136600 [Panicum hallii var. hallii]|uniref:Cullin N-terminal domain-containing protein n=1 Tax=Panicum hallii var. hallii TaxID=1504633 RepID=A0A2T7EPK3_9POAL|nr:hypothetical protein GQ55_2G136600 [Panicum hallii var. hallii]